MDDQKLSTAANMGFSDRTARLFVGGLLAYFGLVNQILSDSNLVNYSAGLFGLVNVISAIMGICPAYILVNFSTLKSSTINRWNGDSGLESHSEQISCSDHEVSLNVESIQRNLLLSIILPVCIVLTLFTYLFFELSDKHHSDSDLIASNAIAEMALLIESTGEESFSDYRTEGVIAIVFHDAYGNIIPTVLEKMPDDEATREQILNRVALDNTQQQSPLRIDGQTINRSTDSLPDRGLHVSVFYTNSTDDNSTLYPLLSRLAFVALLALWVCGWTSHYAIKRYTDYVERSSQAIRYRSTHDLLTGLSNRTGLEDFLRKRIGRSCENNPFSVLTIDIANFHYFNSTLGNELADKLLKVISERLQSTINESEFIARLNGDVFCLILDIDTQDGALDRAETIRGVICQPINLDEIRLDVECKIGLSIFPEQSTDGSELIRLSNIALHNTKGQAQNLCAYEASKDQHDAKSLAIITGLQAAIEQEQLYLVYQPKVDLKSGHLRGVEALVRWQHPIFQNVPPIEFIGWAEKSGLINQLTQWVLTEAERQSKEWSLSGLDIPIAVNLSPINLEDEKILSHIKQSATEGHFKNGLLELELTENAVVNDVDKAIEKLRELIAIGIPISIDDFGTGLASFAYLKNFPVTNLKIDRSFVNTDNPDEHDLALLRSMIDLGHNLDCVVTAEGVETNATLELLQTYGCDYAQGYYVCKPAMPDDIEKWISTNSITVHDLVDASNSELKKYSKAA